MLFVIVSSVTSASVSNVRSVQDNTRPGFSMACQGPRSIGQMTKTAEIVTEAIVVDVSPARDNVYAVTLQVIN